MQIIPMMKGKVAYVDEQRGFCIVRASYPLRASVLVPAAVLKIYGVSPQLGMACDLADVCDAPRGWKASRILKMHKIAEGK